jgi:hypothetical protein
VSTATLVAIVLVVTGIGVIAASRRGPRHLQVGNRPSTTTLPSYAPVVLDWTWVSDDHGWALVRTRCGSSACVGVRETINGGKTWTSLPTPDALDAGALDNPNIACAHRACVSSVRFATAKRGFLFGPDLFQTFDGGHSWTPTATATVGSIEASDGLAMRLTTTDRDCGGSCAYRLDRLRPGASSWEPLPSGPEYAFPHLLLQGADAYDVNTPNPAGAGESVLRYSSDAGTTWTPIDDPCAQPRDGYRTMSASAAPGGVLVVLCANVGGTVAAIQISTDRGRTFGPRREVSGAPLNAEPVAAASAGTIAVGYSDGTSYGVLVTNDGGRSWRTTLTVATTPSGPDGFYRSLGWQDAHTGRVSFNTDAIWTTRDGGRSWKPDRITP